MATRKVMVRLEPDTYEEMMRFVEEDGNTMSGFIRRAVEKAVEMRLLDDAMIKEYLEEKKKEEAMMKEAEEAMEEFRERDKQK